MNRRKFLLFAASTVLVAPHDMNTVTPGLSRITAGTISTNSIKAGSISIVVLRSSNSKVRVTTQ